VHLRNRNGRTPLFLAANAGLPEHVSLLRRSGAHLHQEELAVAELYARHGKKSGANSGGKSVWELAGVEVSQEIDGDTNGKVNSES
jgi:lysophospholipase